MRTGETLHKKASKNTNSISIFKFQYNSTAWEGERGAKARRRLEREQTPTPQIAGEWKYLLLLTRYFFPKECSKITTHKQNNRLEFKFLNFFGEILRSVLLHSSTVLHHIFYFLGKIWCSVALQIGLKIISVLLYYTVVLYYILVFKLKGWDLAHRGNC